MDIWVDEVIHPGYQRIILGNLTFHSHSDFCSGRGFRSSRSLEHGNLIIDFEILFPISLSPTDKEEIASGPLSRCPYPVSQMDIENKDKM